VAESLELIGGRWTLLIVRDLLRGPARFQDLRTMLPGIPPKLLSERLKFMVKQGIVARKFYSDYPPRARYALTDKGQELGLVVGALAAWGSRHVNRRLAAVHADCGHAVEVMPYCPHCKERVRPDSIQIPAATTAKAEQARRRRGESHPLPRATSRLSRPSADRER
jgi:DNA-binding HxlR family transcriptional regulator